MKRQLENIYSMVGYVAKEEKMEPLKFVIYTEQCV